MNFRFVFTLGLAGSAVARGCRQRPAVQIPDRRPTRAFELRTDVDPSRASMHIGPAMVDRAAHRRPVPRQRLGRRLLPVVRRARGDACRPGPLTVDAGRNGGIRVEGWDRNEIHVQAIVTANARSEADAKQLASEVQVQAGGGRVSSTGPSTTATANGGRSATASTCRAATISISTPTTAASPSPASAAPSGSTPPTAASRLTDLGGDVRGETRNGGLNGRAQRRPLGRRRARRRNLQRRRQPDDSRRLQRRPRRRARSTAASAPTSR